MERCPCFNVPREGLGCELLRQGAELLPPALRIPRVAIQKNRAGGQSGLISFYSTLGICFKERQRKGCSIIFGAKDLGIEPTSHKIISKANSDSAPMESPPLGPSEGTFCAWHLARGVKQRGWWEVHMHPGRTVQHLAGIASCLCALLLLP